MDLGALAPSAAYVREVAASIACDGSPRSHWRCAPYPRAHLRTFLHVRDRLGIVSIALMVAAGEGLRKGQADQARNLGKDILIVFHGRTSLQAGGTRAGRAVHWEDADVLAVQAEAPDLNTRSRSWNRTTFALTAVTTMRRLPSLGPIHRSPTFAPSKWARAVSLTGTIRENRAGWLFWEVMRRNSFSPGEIRLAKLSI